jgi:hypothetical protein
VCVTFTFCDVQAKRIAEHKRKLERKKEEKEERKQKEKLYVTTIYFIGVHFVDEHCLHDANVPTKINCFLTSVL